MPRPTGLHVAARVNKTTGKAEGFTISGVVAGVRIRRRSQSNDPKLARKEAAILEAEILNTSWHGERRGVRSFAEALMSLFRGRTAQRGDQGPLQPGVARPRRRQALRHQPGTTATALKAEIAQPNHKPATVTPRNHQSAARRHAPGAGTRLVQCPEVPCSGGDCGAGALPFSRRSCRLPDCRGGTAFACALDVSCRHRGAHGRSGRARLARRGPYRRAGDLLAHKGRQAAQCASAAGRDRSTRQSAGPRGPRVPLDDPPTRKDGTVRRIADYVDRERRCGGQIKTGWAGAIKRAGLDPDPTPHDLRHTWASWHYALNRDLLALKIEGGWSSVVLVERYAHLLPAGQKVAINRFFGHLKRHRRRARRGKQLTKKA